MIGTRNQKENAMKSLLAAVIIAALGSAAWAGDACCGIKAIDMQSGVITAVVKATGTTFRFQVSSAQARGMKVGEAVIADFKTNSVSVQGGTQHFSILPAPITPCCGITNVDAPHGVATARVNATGATFQVIFDPAQSHDGIAAGIAFDANFQSGLAGIGSRNFHILSAAAGATEVYGGEPCCQVKAIDAASRTLTLVGAGGRAFQVRVTNPAALAGIKAGSKLFANSRNDIFSVDGVTPCCQVVP